MNCPKNLKYAHSHEYVETLENGHVRIGLSDYAQSELGDLVFLNLPQEGDTVSAGEPFADVESVKAVADVLSPVSGTVCAINEDLLDNPQHINEDPYNAWFAEVEVDGYSEDLMDSDAYEAFCEEEKNA